MLHSVIKSYSHMLKVPLQKVFQAVNISVQSLTVSIFKGHPSAALSIVSYSSNPRVRAM